MGIFRTNDPTQFDDIDGIIIDEQAPPPSISGVSANVGILVGQFQRGPHTLSLPMGSIGEFHEIYGKSSFSGNKQLKNKKFGPLKIIRVEPTGAAKAAYTFNNGVGTAAEVFTVTTVADVAGSLNNKYILFETISALGVVTPRYAWFNVSAGGTDPAISGRTALPVAISTGDTANAVATALAAALDGLADLGAAAVGPLVTATMANVGDVADAAAGNSGMAVAVTVPGNGADRITFTAKHKGVYGNSIRVKIEDGSVSGKKYTVIDENVGAVLPIEIYDNLAIGSIVASTFAASQLVDVAVLSTAAEPNNVPAGVLLLAGSDGSVVDTDYEAAILKAGVEKAGNVLFLDSYNSLRNGYLKQHCADYQDKMAILCGPEVQARAAAITDVANYRDTDGRLIYAWPWVQTSIDGALEWTPPAAWIASIYTQVAPNVALSFTGNAKFLTGIVDLKYKESRNGFIALDAAGICALEQDLDVGFLVKNAVTTQILSSSKRTIIRRRMADYLQDSIAYFLKNYQNDVNSSAKRDEVKAAILEFDARLVRDGILPGAQDVKDGSPLLVDTESLNTDAVIASGMFKILYKRRIFSSMRYIVLTAEIGESVIVSEANA